MKKLIIIQVIVLWVLIGLYRVEVTWTGLDKLNKNFDVINIILIKK